MLYRLQFHKEFNINYLRDLIDMEMLPPHYGFTYEVTKAHRAGWPSVSDIVLYSGGPRFESQ
jgi:hypothetical protein